MFFRLVQAQKQTATPTRPITSAPPGATKPEAGVIATRPATAPDTMPSTLGLPLVIHSQDIHDNAAAAVANWVTSMAMPARPFEATADPALKPNQPTQSSEAPTMVSTKLCGVKTSPPRA